MLKKLFKRIITVVRDTRETIDSFRRMAAYEHETYLHDAESLNEALVESYEVIELLRSQLSDAEETIARERARADKAERNVELSKTKHTVN